MKVICIGDSNTWGYDPRSYVGDRYEADCRWVDILADKTGWKIINEGVNGMCIPKNPAAFLGLADQWIIMLGTNDILNTYGENVPAIIASTNKHNPVSISLTDAPPPCS